MFVIYELVAKIFSWSGTYHGRVGLLTSSAATCADASAYAAVVIVHTDFDKAGHHAADGNVMWLVAPKATSSQALKTANESSSWNSSSGVLS